MAFWDRARLCAAVPGSDAEGCGHGAKAPARELGYRVALSGVSRATALGYNGRGANRLAIEGARDMRIERRLPRTDNRLTQGWNSG